MKPGVCLSQNQIDAAGRLHQQLRQWEHADRCLATIANQFPGIDEDSCFIKTTVLDRLYGTNLPDLARTAEHIHGALVQQGDAKADIELVEKMGFLPESRNEPARRQGSFASKFAHFFIDSEQFPIMDRYSQRIVAYHLEKPQTRAEQNRSYRVFYAEWKELREQCGIACGCREFDRYLWIAGQYHAHLKLGKKAKLNKEVRELFRLAEDQPDLKLLVPEADRIGRR